MSFGNVFAADSLRNSMTPAITHPNINYIRAPLKIPPKSSKDIINYCMCVPSNHRLVGYYRADKLKAWSLWTMDHSGYYCSTLFVVICTTRVRYLLIEYDLIKTEHRQDQPVLCFWKKEFSNYFQWYARSANAPRLICRCFWTRLSDCWCPLCNRSICSRLSLA